MTTRPRQEDYPIHPRGRSRQCARGHSKGPRSVWGNLRRVRGNGHCRAAGRQRGRDSPAIRASPRPGTRGGPVPTGPQRNFLQRRSARPINRTPDGGLSCDGQAAPGTDRDGRRPAHPRRLACGTSVKAETEPAWGRRRRARLGRPTALPCSPATIPTVRAAGTWATLGAAAVAAWPVRMPEPGGCWSGSAGPCVLCPSPARCRSSGDGTPILAGMQFTAPRLRSPPPPKASLRPLRC